MRQPRGDDTINNTLTEIALFLLFTFGVVIALSGLEAEEREDGLTAKVNDYEYYLYGPPSDMRVLTTIRKPEEGTKPRRVFVMTDAERLALDAGITKSRTDWRNKTNNQGYDTDPCFLKTELLPGSLTDSQRESGGFEVQTETTDVGTGTTTRSKVVVWSRKSISAFGIFASPDVSTTINGTGTPPIYFEAQPRIETIRDNYYPTKDIYQHNAKNDSKKSFINILNDHLENQPPTKDIYDIFLTAGKLMSKHRINCTFHVDIHGVIFNSTTNTSISPMKIQEAQHDCSNMTFSSPGKPATHFQLTANKRVDYRTKNNQRIYNLGSLNEAVARAVCKKQHDTIGRSAVIELPESIKTQFSNGTPPRFYWNSIKAPFPTETLK